MENKGFWRFISIVVVSYVLVTWITALIHGDNWQYSCNIKQEATLVGKLALASILYLFFKTMQSKKAGLFARFLLIVAIIATGGLVYSIFTNISNSTINPFGLSTLFHSATITAIAIVLVSSVTQIFIPDISLLGGIFATLDD